MSTNNQLITRLRQAKKDTATGREQRSAATYAAILTDAQNFLNEELELCRREFTIALVAETREYTMDAAFLKFPSDRMMKKSGLAYWSNGELEPTDPGALDQEELGWRGLDSGTPSRFFLQRVRPVAQAVLQLGLDKKPNADFVAEVPSLTVYGVYTPAAIAANDDDPFDDSPDLGGLHELLIFHSLWALEVEDGNLAKADERWDRFLQKVEAKADVKIGALKTGRGFAFDQSWKR